MSPQARRALCVAGAVLSVAAAAHAAQDAPTHPAGSAGAGRGFSFGLRTGWTFPLGDRARGESMGGVYDGMLPLWVDAGYRPSRRIYVGGYFQYGFLFVASSLCQPPLTGCSGHDVRAGVDVHYHLRPGTSADPWFGGGTGYEGASLRVDGSERSASRMDHGVEYVNLQAGVDFSVERLRLGPFAAFTAGEYLVETVENPGTASRTYELTPRAVHFLLMLGLRAQYDL